MTFVASDERSVKNRKRRERRAKERAQADIRFVMSSKEGRRVMWRLLCDCGVFNTSFTIPNGLTLAFNEGNRNAGLRLLTMLQECCLEEFQLAQAEAAAYEKREAENEAALTPETPEEEDPDA